MNGMDAVLHGIMVRSLASDRRFGDSIHDCESVMVNLCGSVTIGAAHVCPLLRIQRDHEGRGYIGYGIAGAA